MTVTRTTFSSNVTVEVTLVVVGLVGNVRPSTLTSSIRARQPGLLPASTIGRFYMPKVFAAATTAAQNNGSPTLGRATEKKTSIGLVLLIPVVLQRSLLMLESVEWQTMRPLLTLVYSMSMKTATYVHGPPLS